MNIITLKDDIKDYIQSQIDVMKLKVVARAERIVSDTIMAGILLVLGLFALLFLSIAAAYAISLATGKLYMGFLAVGGFYILLAILAIMFRERLLGGPVISALLKRVKYRRAEEE